MAHLHSSFSITIAIFFIFIVSCTRAKNFEPVASNDEQTDIPLVYEVENTTIRFNAEQQVESIFSPPILYPFDELPSIPSLTNPLEWSDGSAVVRNFVEWEQRRNEIAYEIQHYEIGTKPSVPPSAIQAHMSADTLFVTVSVGDSSLTLWTEIHYPGNASAQNLDSSAVFPLMIGTSFNSLPQEIFEGRAIAQANYNELQVNSYRQFGPEKQNTDRSQYPFCHLYPAYMGNGAYSEWAWGLSRLIDGLQQLGPSVTHIDTRHIGVTGCSYAGKMALFCGAFDERIALTIAQEPGGGGCAAWRVSHNMDGVEDLDKTDYHWFLPSLKEQFGGDNVYRLPYDHHELVAMICPRAFLMLGNTDYQWLADGSARVSLDAAARVWEQFGIGDRFGYSINGGHFHCMLTPHQYPEVRAFIDKFLLDNDTINTAQIRRVTNQGALSDTLFTLSGTVPIDHDGYLYYDVCGTGEPLLLLHGHSLDRRMWDKQLAALSPYFRVYRIDLRGYGLSSPQREGEAFTHADDVLAFMNQLGLEKAHVVGLSMGSFIAGDLLAMYPERLLSCTLASGGIRKTPGPSEPMDSLESAKRDEEIALLKAKGLQQYKAEWIETLLKSGGSEREGMRAAITRMVNEWSAWQPLHKEARCYYAQQAWDSLKARQPQVPTLFLKGANEGNKKHSMMTWLPNSQQVVIPNAGHMLNMDQPEAFNQALLQFLLPLRTPNSTQLSE